MLNSGIELLKILLDWLDLLLLVIRPHGLVAEIQLARTKWLVEKPLIMLG